MLVKFLSMLVAAALMVAAAPAPTLPESAANIPAGDTPPTDIVVNATRGRCEIVYAGSPLDGRAIARLADGWPAGRPLRVLEPRAAKRKCLVKVMLTLAHRGFTTVQFVSPSEP